MPLPRSCPNKRHCLKKPSPGAANHFDNLNKWLFSHDAMHAEAGWPASARSVGANWLPAAHVPDKDEVLFDLGKSADRAALDVVIELLEESLGIKTDEPQASAIGEAMSSTAAKTGASRDDMPFPLELELSNPVAGAAGTPEIKKPLIGGSRIKRI
ncbi:hypothetical protein FNU76_03860 [Chitinimonas arctica]|uniref:Uncharacterized protein n=1 Tax=Chitinimonas arctica TaxID=2594795 RepID=A0A516SBM7_9NEIS|nr:hypothetical protein [Chitinimonas arctica]QDQ25555.1 hypothetical protein FNU76_03860 [Chitinimonas arctica]